MLGELPWKNERGVLTYTTTHKEQLKTQALSTQSSSGVRREKIIKEEGSKEEGRQEVEVKQC